MRLLEVGRQVAERAATIRQERRAQKRQGRIRSCDVLIAATAIEYGLTLIARNRRDEGEIPDVVRHDQT